MSLLYPLEVKASVGVGAPLDVDKCGDKVVEIGPAEGGASPTATVVLETTLFTTDHGWVPIATVVLTPATPAAQIDGIPRCAQIRANTTSYTSGTLAGRYIGRSET